MKLELKPFDFAQAVARAGLRPDGHPVGKAAPGAPESGEAASFTTAMSQALRAEGIESVPEGDAYKSLWDC